MYTICILNYSRLFNNFIICILWFISFQINLCFNCILTKKFKVEKMSKDEQIQKVLPSA